jgi:peptidoglycan/LPS O-acetylase OafA/YrhL
MAVVVVPTILIASDLMYRFVERPMIRAGARLANRLAAARSETVNAAGTSAPAV